MQRAKRVLMLGLLGLSLTIQGCPGPSWSSRVRKIEKNSASFTVYLDGGIGLGCLVSKPQVSSISVYRYSGIRKGKSFDIESSQLLWKVVAASQDHEEGAFLCEFEYGKVPKGLARVWLDTDQYGYYEKDTPVSQKAPEVVKFTEQSIVYQDPLSEASALIPGEQIYIRISGDLGSETIDVNLPFENGYFPILQRSF